ncbi:MAG: VapE domain-containing protein [Terriglobia bacterium]
MNFFDYSLNQNGTNKEARKEHYFNSNLSPGAATDSAGLIESDLTASDLAALEARWIDPHLAHAARLRRVDSLTGTELVGRKGGNYSGIAIPYFLPGSSVAREYRLRRDHSEMEIDSQGRVKPRQKYLSPPGRGNMLYFAPGTTDLRDTALPLMITEGEFKTLALSRLANWNKIEHPRFVPVGVSGVYNWRGTVGKTAGPDGERLDVKGPIPDLDRIAWKDRRVIIAYDADAGEKDLVRFARAELARHLRGRGALVGFLEWDAHRGKGIDDHLAMAGPEAVLEEMARVTFAGLRWQDELLRSKVSSEKNENSILSILANAITALRLAPEWQGVLAYDEFRCNAVALKPTPWGALPKSGWTDQEDRLTAEWLQHRRIFVSVEIASQAVQTVAAQRLVHPVRQYLDQLKWDRIPRLDRWLSTYLGVVESNYSHAVGSRWMFSAVARIYRSGAKADCCLILEGPQGIKKSTALRTLAGEYFTDEIADLGSKDASMQIRGVWIVEISELDSLARSEVTSIKAFMSRTTDRFRPPFGKRVIECPRQCVFAGTVNHTEYLRDETGARRFWPVLCGYIDIEALARDRDQLWAEARRRYASGEKWWLDTSALVEIAAEEQAARYQGDPWEEIIEPWLEVRPSTSVSEILEKCINKPQAQWTQGDKNRIGRCLRALGWERYRERTGERLEWRWRKTAR